MASPAVEDGHSNLDVVSDKAELLTNEEIDHRSVLQGEGDGEMTPDAPPSIKEVLDQMQGLSPIDEAVIEALPKGASFSSIERFAKSKWTVTGKVTARWTDGSEQCFFLKIAFGEHGRSLLKGEFESSKMIHSVSPDFIPESVGYRRYKAQDLRVWFYMSEFIDLDVTTAPKPEELMSRLARLHKNSISPTGKFGFPVTTYDGNIPHTVSWESNWDTFFRTLFLNACALDAASNDSWPELDRAVHQMADVVIPRLLGSLRQSDNHELVKPCLIHGDLWEGNRGISKETGDNVVFDASSYFAHNEMEFGNWRSELNTFFRWKDPSLKDLISEETRVNPYITEYLRHFPMTEPVDEFDDRNRLYSIKVAMDYSAMVPGSTRRKTAFNNMCYLIDKYAPVDGIDKYDPALDPSVSGKHFKAYSASE